MPEDLSYAANVVRKPLYVDNFTVTKKRITHVRIYVEVDTARCTNCRVFDRSASCSKMSMSPQGSYVNDRGKPAITEQEMTKKALTTKVWVEVQRLSKGKHQKACMLPNQK